MPDEKRDERDNLISQSLAALTLLIYDDGYRDGFDAGRKSRETEQ